MVMVAVAGASNETTELVVVAWSSMSRGVRRISSVISVRFRYEEDVSFNNIGTRSSTSLSSKEEEETPLLSGGIC